MKNSKEIPDDSKKRFESIRLNSYSDVVFFWPTLITSLILGILSIIPFFQSENILNIFSWIWMITFIYNIFIVAFDFSSMKTFAILAATVAFILLLVVISISIGNNLFFMLTFVFFIDFNLKWEFYTVMAIIFGMIFLIMIVNSKINYVEITSNRVYMKKGILSDKFDLPTSGMQVEKEIDDVFEYLVLKSGDLKLVFPPGAKYPIILLPNIMNINKKIEQINFIISKTEVDID